ncbi:MAG: primosomal protein N' [Candidatus Omnitrophica bacterium]|nr:primosomal protein N' [Candidatus Omnitrophota bacterium]
MLYAKVVLAIPVEGPFDYLIPEEAEKLALAGMRAWVNFRGKKEIGYIVETTSHSDIPRIKPIIKLVDSIPVLDEQMLLLTSMVSNYYCCSWGEAIAASLPEPIRKGKPLEGLPEIKAVREKNQPQGLLLADLDGKERWDIYCREIQKTLAGGKSAIVLVSDKNLVLKAKELISKKTGLILETSFRQQPNEIEEWIKIKNNSVKVVVGTRSSIFAPMSDLGLIIVDEEMDSAYKQDQSPHYHSRRVALMRAELEKARIILGGIAVSLESIYLAHKENIEFKMLERREVYPEIKIVDMKSLPFLDKKKNIILSRLLQDTMAAVLTDGGKILLFLNRKGFATAAVCSTCAKSLRCPRCSTNLVYFFEENLLRCHYCNYKLVPPKICPQCNSGYLKFAGAGTEKVESELSRIFPQARIKRIDSGEIPDKINADIFISTQGIIRQAPFAFELTAVLGIDNSLNHVDFRATEKTFAILQGLLTITKEKLFIQTSLPNHFCFQAIAKKDINIFYNEELKSRRQVKFPPYRNFCQVRLRGRIESRVREAGEKLFKKLSAGLVPKGVEIVSLNPGQPPKLRGNYYWVILLAASNVLALSKFLKNSLKDFRQSGIIITIDVDPI